LFGAFSPFSVGLRSSSSHYDPICAATLAFKNKAPKIMEKNSQIIFAVSFFPDCGLALPLFDVLWPQRESQAGGNKGLRHPVWLIAWKLHFVWKEFANILGG